MNLGNVIQLPLLKEHLILYGSTLTYLTASKKLISVILGSLQTFWVNSKENPALDLCFLPLLPKPQDSMMTQLTHACSGAKCSWGLIRNLQAQWTMAHVKSCLVSDVRAVQKPVVCVCIRCVQRWRWIALNSPTVFDSDSPIL